jgi:hypothetical protein
MCDYLNREVTTNFSSCLTPDVHDRKILCTSLGKQTKVTELEQKPNVRKLPNSQTY